MNFEDLIRIYENWKEKYGNQVYEHISEILDEAKIKHKNDWMRNKTPNGDHEQSWRAFKGKNFEKLVMYIIKEEVEALGLKVIDGNYLERATGANLSIEDNKVKRNLLIDYGKFGSFLPDVDLIIYNPRGPNVLAVVSNKITLRERIAQTGYWKIKLSQDELTKSIKVFFVTPDEDGTLIKRFPPKKGRAIVEIDTDGSYVMTEEKIEETDKVKKFDKFIPDLRRLLNGR
ncbi:MAG: BsaWI family type II restriction enzyme [Thermodesulfobium sp.]